jgi:hypothetical protein
MRVRAAPSSGGDREKECAMTDRKREPLTDLKQPKFMKPGDDPELDRGLDRLRFDSDIYVPGEYDVFGRRRNLKGLPPSQRDLPPWGAPPNDPTEPTAPPEGTDATAPPEHPGEPPASPEATEPSPAPEHAELEAPPVASRARQPTTKERRRNKLWLPALAVLAALAPATVVLVILAPRVNPKPPQTSASTTSASAVAAPTTSALKSDAPPSSSPTIGTVAPTTSAVAPTTSAVAPPAPGPSHAPTGRLKPRATADDPYDAAVPPPPTMVTAAPPPTVAPITPPTVAPAPTAAPKAAPSAAPDILH